MREILDSRADAGKKYSAARAGRYASALRISQAFEKTGVAGNVQNSGTPCENSTQLSSGNEFQSVFNCFQASQGRCGLKTRLQRTDFGKNTDFYALCLISAHAFQSGHCLASKRGATIIVEPAPPPKAFFYNLLMPVSSLSNGRLMPIAIMLSPPKEASMADIVFFGLGIVLIALMGGYAIALSRA